MASLEPRIDDLFKGPLDAFVSRRAELAKSLTGEDARRVKALKKPTVVPWAINQVYWHARPVYERVRATGEAARKTQMAGLRGRSADVRGATDAHRKAVADAVAEAVRRASAVGVHASPEEIARTLQALSLAQDPPDPPGRLTRALQPAGFEALAGIPISAIKMAPAARPGAEPAPPVATAGRLSPRPPDAAARRKAAAEQRRALRAQESAERALALARKAEARARAAWERAKNDLEAAEHKRAQLSFDARSRGKDTAQHS